MMTRRNDLMTVHSKCLDLERDADGNLTGNVCKKSYGHVEAKDPRRRAHFDPDRGGVIWGLDVEAMTGS